MGYSRRDFLKQAAAAASVAAFANGIGGFLFPGRGSDIQNSVEITAVQEQEDVFNYIKRCKGRMDFTLYRQVIGAANPFKEGDLIVGVAALNDTARHNARSLIINTRVKDFHDTPLYADDIQALINSTIDQEQYRKVQDWTMGQLKSFLLSTPEPEIKNIMYGLNSEIIGCLVKLMSNRELIEVSRKVFNPLPGSNIGAKGYMGARVQPNSPTDNPEEIRWQVFDAWCFGVGDVVLGTNPVSSSAKSVAAIEKTLLDVIRTFGLQDILPHSVLAHIDVQAQVEKQYPGSTDLWFQSLGGTVESNRTFDVTVDKMMNYATQRTGKYGLYVETGQGADFTNGHGCGFDMVVHESRKYGFLRALKQKIALSQHKKWPGPWVHVNDVAGFIGPEVFRTREQLVRTCLEDTLMGKLHGLTIGLDICSTLHMEVSLDDLDWCISQVMPANPAYLMALPTKNDPMLGYLTTGYHDHLRVRDEFGYKVNDAMWEFFKRINVLDQKGKPTTYFGDPVWVYCQYRRAKKDTRPRDIIFAEGRKKVKGIQAQGVPLAIGYGQNYWDMPPELNREVLRLYKDAKLSVWSELQPDFIDSIPHSAVIKTTSRDRNDYIGHPESGERLSNSAMETLTGLCKKNQEQEPDVWIVISDGLNARAIMDSGHLAPYLEELRAKLEQAGYKVADDHVVTISGRVRAGYRCGEILFAGCRNSRAHKVLIHIIGERPGTGHHNFSAYFCAPLVRTWTQKGKVDHNIARVVSGISDTALTPVKAAGETVRILNKITGRPIA